jgi:hypothetical protein
MSYLLNYKSWRALYEARSINEAQSWVGNGLVPIKPGNQVYDYSASDVTPESGYGSVEENARLTALAKQVCGQQAIPELYTFQGAAAGYRKVDTAGTAGVDAQFFDFFKLVLSGIGHASGVENLADALKDPKTDMEMISKLQIKSQLVKSIQLYGPDAGRVNTTGKVKPDGSIDTQIDTTASSIKLATGYMNTFNLENWGAGDFTQYTDPGKSLNSANVLSFVSVGDNKSQIEKEQGVLYLYALKKGSVDAAGIDKQVKNVEGEAGKTGSVDLNFGPYDYAKTLDGNVVNETHPLVQEIGQKIRSFLTDDEQISEITLTSSASPEWAGVATTTGNGVGDPSKGKLTPATFKTDKTPLGNQYLAWLRGETFKNALYRVLGERLTPNSITVNWVIAQEEGASGRNLNYIVNTKGKAPKQIVDTKYVGAQVKTTGGNLEIYQYKISFDEAAVTAAKSSWLNKATGGLLGSKKVAYADVQVDQEIKYYGKYKDENNNSVIHVPKDYDASVKQIQETDLQRGGKLGGKSWEENLKTAKVVAKNNGKIEIKSTIEGNPNVPIPKERFYTAGVAKSGGEVAE